MALKLSVTAKDDKTLEVTLYNKVSYWNELLAFPSYFPVREDVVSNDSWATDPSTFICNGAYTMDSWEHNSVITLVKNDSYVDAENVTMDAINFYLSDDANNMLTNYKNGSWQLIDDVPTNEIASLKASYPDNFVVAGQLGTYYISWNNNYSLLPASSTLTGADKIKAENEIRNALALIIDRNYIVDNIAQGGQIPASSFVAMGLTDADGSQFYENAGGNSYPGYYDVSADSYQKNWNSAIETLKKYYTYDEASGKFTDAPAMTYLYNTSDAHKAIAEALRKELNALETQQERLYEFLEQGIYTSEVFVKRNAALAQRRKELQEAIETAKSYQVSEADYQQKIIALHDAVAMLEDPTASAEEKNNLLRTVIKDITYHRETEVRDKWHPVPFFLDISLI